VKVHRGRLIGKMKAGSLPALSRMADKLKLVPEEQQHFPVLLYVSRDLPRRVP
jgi:hypothetical protein